MFKQQIVKRAIVDCSGTYVVRYLPGRKIEIKFPGTEHIIVVGPIRSRKNTGITVVNPQGAVTNIPTFDPENEGVAQTRNGLAVATLFVPVIADFARIDPITGKPVPLAGPRKRRRTGNPKGVNS